MLGLKLNYISKMGYCSLNQAVQSNMNLTDIQIVSKQINIV